MFLLAVTMFAINILQSVKAFECKAVNNSFLAELLLPSFQGRSRIAVDLGQHTFISKYIISVKQLGNQKFESAIIMCSRTKK